MCWNVQHGSVVMALFMHVSDMGHILVQSGYCYMPMLLNECAEYNQICIPAPGCPWELLLQFKQPDTLPSAHK